MFKSKLLIAACLVSFALAKPHARDMTVRESRESIPAGYVHSGAADADTTINLRIALVQNNPSGLIDALYDVSTPSSPSYGEHLSKEEVNSLPGPLLGVLYSFDLCVIGGNIRCPHCPDRRKRELLAQRGRTQCHCHYSCGRLVERFASRQQGERTL